ncbi:MAG: DUF58 domain-containing protein [Oscillospiraceae bacterium]|nr:DUF58 domain-containing protein [Oscillospiraceae bacterium]
MPHDKRKDGAFSSLLVAWPMIGGSIAAAIILFWQGLHAFGGLMVMLCIVGLLARLWGDAALHHVTAECESSCPAVYVGQTMTVRYHVENEKLLPLIWLEIGQPLPPRDCLALGDGFSRAEASGQAQDAPPEARQNIAFLLGGRALRWERTFTARARGVYRFDALKLHSGDGFGLVQNVCDQPLAAPPTFVVWPKRIPVQPEPLLQNLLGGQSAGAGFYEDVTLLKNIRAYADTDSWKRIDWRMAARQEELQVKQFETVLPHSVLFVLDAASFSPAEYAISATASLIAALMEKRMQCGLFLPKTAACAPVSLLPGTQEAALEAILFALSAFDAETATAAFDDRLLLARHNDAGRTFVLTHSGASCRCQALLRQLDVGMTTALTFSDDDPNGVLLGFSKLPFSRLEKGGAPS